MRGSPTTPFVMSDTLPKPETVTEPVKPLPLLWTKSTWKRGSTSTQWPVRDLTTMAFWVVVCAPRESATVSTTLSVPALVKTWETFCPLPVDPSPKFQV